jgi:hypothetical protein
VIFQYLRHVVGRLVGVVKIYVCKVVLPVNVALAFAFTLPALAMLNPNE